MNIKIIPAVFILLKLVFAQSTCAQTQLNISEYIRQRFQSYCKSTPREEIFIHTDKEEYISGEDMWLNIYLIDRQSFKPSSNSKIAYFEILNPENKPVIQKKILLDNGFGPGQVVLPDTLSSGTYTIRAYTNWMKNFLPFNCFLKDLKVYNPYRTKVFSRIVRPVKLKSASADSLPARSSVSMKTNNLIGDTLEIFLHTNEKFRSENTNLIYLFIQTHGIIDHLSTERIDEDVTRITVPKNLFHKGINQITILDSKGPVIDRLIYTPSIEKQETILHSADSFNRRSKIALEIEPIIGSSGVPDLTNLSISVALGTNCMDIMDLKDYLIFGSEFDVFAQSKINGKKINELPSKTMDSLLLTLKSNWINWDSIFSPYKQYFRYPTEKEVHYISGRLLTSKLQPERADEVVIMSTIGREAAFQYTTTDNNGDFNFMIGIDDEPSNLIIQPDNKIKNQKVNVEQSFSDQYFRNDIIIDSTSKRIPFLISRQSINHQVREIYGSKSAGKRLTLPISEIKQKRFYGKPDFELNFNDFVRLDSMQEVFFELIPHVTLEYNNSKYEMSVINHEGKKLEGVPTILIDGIIIKDLSVIAKLDPELVEKIEVVWDTYRVGAYFFNGIVNIILKTGLFGDILPYDAVRLHNIAIDTVCSFVSPDYSLAENKNNRVADYRNTLYWNPSVKPGKDGKARIEFWSSDNKSDYIINIQGITSYGKIISLRKILKVN